MGIIIKEKKHYLSRFLLGVLIIVFIGLSPMIIGILGAIIVTSMGKSCNEGDCIWGVLPWLIMYTAPVAVILFNIFLVIVGLDTIMLFIKSKK